MMQEKEEEMVQFSEPVRFENVESIVRLCLVLPLLEFRRADSTVACDLIQKRDEELDTHLSFGHLHAQRKKKGGGTKKGIEC